ncbi:HNH endonuclease [Sulfurimonas aquatica]|uniref:HNH endonuclease n=1 Tax=Sulfurimonas aquatica TaxID=2672570 RepID=A0A975AZJ9_9BACT|nr:HNH endonuclease [Sulfurimonas aquatica]QSZ41370.1 HNH endonuclease [Sulfurimonas aquatica]
MPRITIKEITYIYELAKSVYFNQTSKKNALIEAEKLGMNRGSASDIIYNFKCMYEGRHYARTNNAETLEYFFENFLKDFGESILKNALQSVMLNIEYYEKKSPTNMHKSRQIVHKYTNMLNRQATIIYPDDIDETEIHYEGAKKETTVNRYERDSSAREKCIEYYGLKCQVCLFNFEDTYGAIGTGFIHVHHIRPISEIGKEYRLNPIKDLRPVCPNCHAMLHKENPPINIDKLKEIIYK